MAYNTTWMDNATTMADMVEGVNTMSGGVLGIVILFLVWLFVFAYTANKGTVVAMLNSTVVASFVGTMLWLGGLLTWPVLIVPVILAGLSLVYYYFNK